MRLDAFLEQKKFFSSRTKAQQAIKKNEIYIDGKLLNKPSFNIDESIVHEYKRVFTEDFVSLGGFKLSKALADFNFSVKDYVCLDIGASTGGFTDCLIKNGAKKVYAIDVNDTLLDEKLKHNSKVFPIIKNAKDLSLNDFNDKIDFITVDLSFISATTILPVVYKILENNSYAIILIKPQFEMEKRINFKNGIIKDKKLISNACEKIINSAKDVGFIKIAITDAPLYKDKNHEFLILLQKDVKK